MPGLVLLVLGLELLALVVEVPWVRQRGLRLVLEERVVQYLNSRAAAKAKEKVTVESIDCHKNKTMVGSVRILQQPLRQMFHKVDRHPFRHQP